LIHLVHLLPDESEYTLCPERMRPKCLQFPPHMNNVFALAKLEMLIESVLQFWVVTERNSRIYPTSSVASKFARFESSWLQCTGTVAREVVQNTYHLPKKLKQRLRTEWWANWIMSLLWQLFVTRQWRRWWIQIS